MGFSYRPASAGKRVSKFAKAAEDAHARRIAPSSSYSSMAGLDLKSSNSHPLEALPKQYKVPPSDVSSVHEIELANDSGETYSSQQISAYRFQRNELLLSEIFDPLSLKKNRLGDSFDNPKIFETLEKNWEKLKASNDEQNLSSPLTGFHLFLDQLCSDQNQFQKVMDLFPQMKDVQDLIHLKNLYFDYLISPSRLSDLSSASSSPLLNLNQCDSDPSHVRPSLITQIRPVSASVDDFYEDFSPTYCEL
eukprot:Sdes_comp19320_c0_seq2m10471